MPNGRSVLDFPEDNDPSSTDYVHVFSTSGTDRKVQIGNILTGVTTLQSQIEILKNVAHNLPLSSPASIGSFGSSGYIVQPETLLSSDGSTLYVFSRYGRFHTVNTTTLVATQGLSFGAGQAIDPALVVRPNGDWWVFYSENDDQIYRVISTDQGATWSAATSLHDQSASGHYEDFHAIQFSNGDILVTCEWEITDKGESHIHTLRYDDSAGTWGTRQVILDTASVDFENPFPFIDPEDGKLKMMVAYEAAADVTYDQNQLYILTSDDEGVTWGSPALLLSDFSFVEYGGDIVGRRLLMTSTRGYDGDGFEPFNGYYSLKNFSDITGFESVWTAWDSAPILVDGSLFLAPITGNSNKLFVSREVGAVVGNEVRIKARLKSVGASTPDLRITFGFVDEDNHYLVVLNGLANASGFYKRISGSYTLLSSSKTKTIVDSQWYEVEVRWNTSTGAMSIYIDNVLFDSITDTSLTAVESVGTSSSELSAQQFVWMDWIQVSQGQELLWRDDFSNYPSLTSVGPNTSTVAFLSGPVVFDEKVWWLLEDRDAGVIEVFESYFE